MAQALITHTKDMLDSFHNNALLTRPEGRRLTQLEHEMANILARTDLTDRQKMEQFSHTLQNFQKVRGVIIDNGLMLTSTNSTVVPSETREKEAEQVFSRIQDIIQTALTTEKNETQETPPTISSVFNPSKLLKIKKTPKPKINPVSAKRLTRAAAKTQVSEKRKQLQNSSKRLKTSGVEYTPTTPSNQKVLTRKRPFNAIKGNGYVNFDNW